MASRTLKLLGAAVVMLMHSGCARFNRPFGFEPLFHPDEAVLIRGVPAVLAQDEQISAIASVMHYWGRPVAPGDIEDRRQSGRYRMEERQWTSLLADEHGLWAFVSDPADMEDLKARLRDGIPVIVLLKANVADTHWSSGVVLGFSDRRKAILWRPGNAKVNQQLSYAGFEAAWTAAGNAMLTLCPPDTPSWPLTPDELADRGLTYETIGRPEDALADFEAAIAQGKNNAVVCIRLGNVARLLKNHALAENAYRNALLADPMSGRAFNNLAFVLAENDGDLDEAMIHAKQAYILSPANPMVLDTMGFVLYKQGNYKESVSFLDKAYNKSSNLPKDRQVDIALHLVWARLKNGDTQLARQVLGDVLKMKPDITLPPELETLRKMRGHSGRIGEHRQK